MPLFLLEYTYFRCWWHLAVFTGRYFHLLTSEVMIMSKGENKIIDILNHARVKFVREKTFSDLRHGKFRYDFYFQDAHGGDCIIEFNGE